MQTKDKETDLKRIGVSLSCFLGKEVERLTRGRQNFSEFVTFFLAPNLASLVFGPTVVDTSHIPQRSKVRVKHSSKNSLTP